MSTDGDQTSSSRLDSALDRAAAHLREAGLVIMPTDTVYGIGALACDPHAVAHLLATKGRGPQMPPPVLVAGPQQLEATAVATPSARLLMEAFWPGPLTLVLDADPRLGWDLGETGGTIAVRVPDHPLALALLRRTGPLAVTSANHTGQAPATDAGSARDAFPGRVRLAQEADGGGLDPGTDILLLDGGPTPGPVPSTIVSLARGHAHSPRILREGRLSREQVLGRLGAPAPQAVGAAACAALTKHQEASA